MASARSILAVLAILAFAAAFPFEIRTREKVVGGEAAEVSDFPYMVSLSTPAGSHFCGGSLLNDRTVITAAHCVADTDASRVTVRAGSIYTNNGGVAADADRLIVHPNYNPDNSNSDIAIVKLNQPIAAQGGISYVALPPMGSDLANGTRVKAAGWGATDTAGTIFSETLRMVEVPATARQTCNEIWGGGVDITMVCAGEPLGGRDVCIGDSGGPLILIGSSTIVGTVSYGNPCALPDFPTVYANVAYFLDFIAQNS